MKLCFACNQTLPREKFSNKQWQLKHFNCNRRCKVCIDANREVKLEEAPNNADDGPGRMESKFQVDENTKLHQMKGIVRELFESEVAWIKSLPVREKKKLFSGQWRDPPINHICSTGEVALVLAGIKPCSIVSTGHYPDYGRLYYEHVLHPWYERYFAESSGFICELSAPGVASYTGSYGDGMPVHTGFGNSSVFRNSKHEDAAHLAEMLTRTDRDVTNEEMRVSFGFPGSYNSGGNTSLVVYQFQNPEVIYKMKKVCCSPCLDYTASEADAANVGRHFRRCREAMQSLGYSIALDVDKQDEPRAWSAMSIAVAWFEASGRNMREFDHMFFAD
jgi:hypothetical protein